MKIKTKSLLTIALTAYANFTLAADLPKSVVATFKDLSANRDSSLIAVLKNNRFLATKENNTETIELSGRVELEDSKYLIDINIVRKNKLNLSSNTINTTIIKAPEDAEIPELIGGSHNERVYLNLQFIDKTK